MSRPYLGPRQRECLRLAAAGLQYREIGERLGLTASTVKIHLRCAKRALGGRNTVHAVALAIHYGFVTAEHLEMP